MKENDNNPLGLEDKLYTVEEFGADLRNKFGGDNYISNVMLAEIFLAKYPIYSCKIKKIKNPHLTKKLWLLLEFKLIKP
jgi:hypothetical protein